MPYFLLSLLAILAAATPHITVATTASATTAKPGATVSLYVDVMPDAKIHVYAPGAKDYMSITVELAPAAGVRAAKLKYPKSQILVVEGLKEQIPVYSAPFRLVQDVTVGSNVKPGTTVKVSAVLKYQACDDAVCFNPVSAPVGWTLEVK
jgi:Thiol:disulfide interchange protein DsbD, N-terminal